MICIVCTGDTRVIDSSYFEDRVTRKKKKKNCGHIFWTEELRVEEDVSVPNRHLMGNYIRHRGCR